MNKIALIYDDIFLAHDSPSHPENASRLRKLTEELSRCPFRDRLEWFKSEMITEKELEIIHSKEMINAVKEAATPEGSMLDPDTYAVSGSYMAALSAAGSGKKALDLVFNKGYKKVFCLTRPPGHHATSSRSMGFCIFNNISLCAKIALKQKKVDKVAIIDWDVHHGNGTEEIFYTDPKVLFMSVHQSPHYPGTGRESETGLFKGKGFNINAPLPSGAGVKDYLRVFDEKFKPAVMEFVPQLILVSAGFDGHYNDPLAGHSLDSDGYGELAKKVAMFSEKTLANGRIIAFLEGGYHLKGLADSVLAVLWQWLSKCNNSGHTRCM